MKQYTTERGVTVGIVPIPLLLENISRAHADIPPVTYTEHLAGGATQEIEITPVMAAIWAKDNPEGWAEHAEKWAAYQTAVKARADTVSAALWLAVKSESLKVTLPKGDAWVKQLAGMGIAVPDDPDERRDCYIENKVIAGKHDMTRIMALAYGADLTEEQLDAVEASF
jgi:hypothetical protein